MRTFKVLGEVIFLVLLFLGFCHSPQISHLPCLYFMSRFPFCLFFCPFIFPTSFFNLIHSCIILQASIDHYSLFKFFSKISFIKWQVNTQGCHNCQSSLFIGLSKLLFLFQICIHSSPKLRPLTLIPAMKSHMQSAPLLVEYLAGSEFIGSGSPEHAVMFMNVHAHIHTHSSV